jgi:hypothetical protein
MTTTDKSRHMLTLLLLLTILFINIFILVHLTMSKKPESFCNCFAAQYDGSPGNPDVPSYYGGYCYNKEKITKLYDEGAFEKTFAGV